MENGNGKAGHCQATSGYGVAMQWGAKEKHSEERQRIGVDLFCNGNAENSIALEKHSNELLRKCLDKRGRGIAWQCEITEGDLI